jgi:DNA-binding beta-propeller fold protein YncE
MTRVPLLACACLALLSCSSGAGAGSGGEQTAIPGYRVLRDVPLPGDTSRWDYQAYDASARRLYLAHMGASQVVAFDSGRNRAVGVVGGVDTVHGLALAPDLGRVFASATGVNRLVAIDTATLRTLGSAPTQGYPDGIAYAPNAGRVFVSNEQGSGDTVIDAHTMQRVTDVQLGSDIGNSYYDPADGRVYVAVGSDHRLAVVDPRTATVVGGYQLPGCQGAHGVQLDPGHSRAFVGCEGNARLVVVDLGSGRVDATFPVGETPDVLAVDAGLHRLYVAAESAQVAVFDISGSVRKLGQGSGGPNAHSVAVDSQTHVVYLPLTSVGGRPVLRELTPR